MFHKANYPGMNNRPVEAAVLRRQSHSIIANLHCRIIAKKLVVIIGTPLGRDGWREIHGVTFISPTFEAEVKQLVKGRGNCGFNFL
jgi:hypothetical protein